MSINLNLFISEKTNNVLTDFKKDFNYANKSMALEDVIIAGVKALREKKE